MTPVSLTRLKELQDRERDSGDTALNRIEQDQLDALRRELAASPEIADNPATPFVDESRRPNLDGTDWNDTNHAAACMEVEALLLKFGAVVGRAAIEAVLAKR